jgi:hypothetical protein
MTGTFPGSIFRNDVMRTASESFLPRSVMNQAGVAAATADFEDRAKHGGKTTTAEISAEWRKRLDEEKEAEALRPFTEGTPPGGNTLQAWKAWCDGLRDELDTLHTAAERLQKHLQAPEATQRSLTEAIARGARRMLAGLGVGTAEPELEGSALAPGQLEARLAAERRASAEASAALEIVNAKIRETEQRLRAVRARADEFVRPAIRAIMEPLSVRYIRAVNELREVMSLMWAAVPLLGGTGTYGSGFDNFEFSGFNLPRPGLDGTKLVPDSKLKIRIDDKDVAFWRNARESLLADPRAKISLPKSS